MLSLRMEKLALVGNYLNNRMRRPTTGDLSPLRRAGEVCFGREEVREKSQRSHCKHCPCAISPMHLLIKSWWRSWLYAQCGKITIGIVHKWGTLILENYSALCMIVISTTLKQVKVVVVSALNMAENELLVCWNPLLLFISMTPPERLNVTVR